MARLAFFAAMLLDAVSAHTIMQQIVANGQTYPTGDAIYMPTSNVYQSDVTANTLACNGAPATGFTASKNVIAVNAGDSIKGQWLHEIGSTGAGNDADNKVIASSHKGPVIAYMKRVTDATVSPATTGPGSGWFKVAEAGLISSTQWAVDKLISDGGLQTVKIPSCLASGDYLLRFEIIALHSASQSKQAQFYMECAQIRVTGAASPTDPGYLQYSGIYSATDPGILISIYNGQGQPYPSSYKIPGPPVFTCSANGGSTNPAPSSSKAATSAAPTTKATTLATSVRSTSAVAASPTSGGSVALYGQCGGQGYIRRHDLCFRYLQGFKPVLLAMPAVVGCGV